MHGLVGAHLSLFFISLFQHSQALQLFHFAFISRDSFESGILCALRAANFRFLVAGAVKAKFVRGCVDCKRG
jgi:hypothetical protein